MKKENKIKCPNCGISVPDVPEDATGDEMLCNGCYEIEQVEDDFLKKCLS